MQAGGVKLLLRAATYAVCGGIGYTIPFAHCDRSEKISDSTSVRVYLTPESQKRLQEYLVRIGHPGYGSKYVVLQEHANASVCKEYFDHGILGHRVAFRVTGLIIADGFISVSYQ